MKAYEFITEKWSEKYKRSINCSHPKGFSQRAHCAGKKKHNESVEMEQVCPDCGMCRTHGNVMEIRKGAKDANGYTRCWPGKHAEGTKKGRNGGQVRNCVPNESVTEGHSDQQRKVFKKNGHPVGEVGIDRESSPGVGQYYMKHYASGKDLAGYDSFEEAVAELKHCMKQGVAENKELAEEFDLIESIIEDLAGRNGVDSEVIWEDLESLTDDELYVFAVTQPIMEDLDEMDRRGFLKTMGAGAAVAGASSLGANTAFAQSMPNINTQKLNLANKYYAALVQRAKEDGLPLDTRTTNMLKAKAEEMATRQLRQTQPQASSYPGAQSSEIQRSNNYNQFESEAWQKANKRDKTDGMSRKAVKSYRREHPGSKLQTAVTTKPSKLKKGSKASKRRKSYCSRSKGQMKMHNISCAKTPDKAICKARRRWNC